ncbi:MAG: energy-coupling factor ABC transporter permease, partial [Desulfobulbaceae bacterium]|nr:energy-coupling factor ABC transporter permease [Desulfobulbaceae bacterium]
LRPWLARPKSRPLAAFAGGFLSVFLASLLMALALALSDTGFLATAKLVVAVHLPVMIIEGFITMFTVSFLARVKPEILQLGVRNVDT